MCSYRSRLMRSPVLRNKSISPAPMKRLVPLSHKRSSFSRSMSRSLSPRKTKRLSSKVEGRAPTPDNDSLLDNINTKCSVKSKVVKPDAREQPTSDEKLRNTRCRDFDEKGLCLRGELCPYDHGTDPFVLEDVVGRNVPVPASVAQNNFGPKQLSDKPMTSFMNVFNPLRHPHPGNGEYYPESPGILPHFGWNGQVRPRHQFRPRHLNFDAAPFSGRGGPPHPSLMRPYGFHMPRQLVTIPVDGSAQSSPGPSFGEPPFPGGPWMCRGVFGTRGRGRGMFDFRRLGVRSGKQMGNCCLEVRKIPQDLNKIEALINHFSRFGNVVSIQTNWDNDPEGALVTFSNQDEAHQAYRSSDAVLNNRFIRVFWYNKEKDQSKGNQQHEFEFSHTSEPQSKVKSKYLSEQPYQAGLPSFIPVKDTNTSAGGAPLDQAIADRPNEVVKDDEPVDVDSAPVLQPLEPLLETPKKPQNDSYSADLLKTRDSMMRLMTTQIEEQKKLILHLETNRDRMNPKQIEDYKALIGSLQKSCGELGRNLAVVNSNLAQNSTSNNNGNPTTNPKLCSKEEISRKILDAELELYALERNGQETSEIEKKILKLRDEELSFISGS
ncbi:RNA-binding protein 27 [Orchesella cincta]|uniref:RNA-binding protein 27 n=1 Tax=Orchesella cincta TaxID=48709 RepID=A0A1D2NBG5_ORCCI|nr:RNA-binding protein 27 [Orchesella cincta]